MTDFYESYISSPDWKKKRRERLAIDKNQCQTCGETVNLEIHHKHYRNLGHENVEEDLITLCRWCHDAITNSIRERRYEKRTHKIIQLEEPEVILNASKQRVSPKVSIADVDAQLPNGRSYQSIRQSYKGYIGQTEEN